MTCSMVKWFSGSLGGGATGSHIVACHCNKWWSDPGGEGWGGEGVGGGRKELVQKQQKPAQMRFERRDKTDLEEKQREQSRSRAWRH